jgi:hypothetical protein
MRDFEYNVKTFGAAEELGKYKCLIGKILF